MRLLEDAGALIARSGRYGGSANRIRGALESRMEGDVKSGIAAFAPWLPCSASALLTRAEWTCTALRS